MKASFILRRSFAKYLFYVFGACCQNKAQSFDPDQKFFIVFVKISIFWGIVNYALFWLQAAKIE